MQFVNFPAYFVQSTGFFLGTQGRHPAVLGSFPQNTIDLLLPWYYSPRVARVMLKQYIRAHYFFVQILQCLTILLKIKVKVILTAQRFYIISVLYYLSDFLLVSPYLFLTVPQTYTIAAHLKLCIFSFLNTSAWDVFASLLPLRVYLNTLFSLRSSSTILFKIDTHI